MNVWLIRQLFLILGHFGVYLDTDSTFSKSIINLSNYSYPKKENDTSSTYTIAILGTNDIHGSAFPLEITHPITKQKYLYGGLEYLATYIKLLRRDWGERLLWLDGGDQFQGAIESKLSDGKIITDFFNALALNASAIGNHEFDYDRNFLKDRLNKAEFTYLSANMVDLNDKPEFLPNTKRTKIFKVGEINVGVIGLITVDTPITTGGNVKDIKFLAYKDLVISLSKELREQGAHSVILTSHIGMFCPTTSKDKFNLHMRNSSFSQGECREDDEMPVLLHSLPEGVVDAVIAGHSHDIAHHFINNIPIIQNINGGYYSSIIYLQFDKATKKLIPQNTLIEGPIPTCEKIFSKTKRCDYINKTVAMEAGNLTQFTFHDSLIKSDENVKDLFQIWWEKVKPYKNKISFTEINLHAGNDRENPLGNIIADAMQQITKADVSIMNDGGIRSNWFPGDITIEHVWNMMPFENEIVTFSMTGEQLHRMMYILQNGKRSYYHTSGLTQVVNSNILDKFLKKLQLRDGTPIQLDKNYTICTLDFLIEGGGNFKNVISWFKPTDSKLHGKLRDSMVEYLNNTLKYIKEDIVIDRKHPRLILE